MKVLILQTKNVKMFCKMNTTIMKWEKSEAFSSKNTKYIKHIFVFFIYLLCEADAADAICAQNVHDFCVCIDFRYIWKHCKVAVNGQRRERKSKMNAQTSKRNYASEKREHENVFLLKTAPSYNEILYFFCFSYSLANAKRIILIVIFPNGFLDMQNGEKEK